MSCCFYTFVWFGNCTQRLFPPYGLLCKAHVVSYIHLFLTIPYSKCLLGHANTKPNRKCEMHVLMYVLFILTFSIPHAKLSSHPLSILLCFQHISYTCSYELYIHNIHTMIILIQISSCLIQIPSFVFRFSNVWTQSRNHALILLFDSFGY